MANGRGKNPNSLRALAENRGKTQFRGARAVEGAWRSNATQAAYKTFREGAREALTPDVMESITRAMIEKAAAGDVRAYEAIRDTVGEKPTDTIDLTGGAALQIELTIVE